MDDTEQIDVVDAAVKALHRGKFCKLSAWTDDISQFKSYTEVRTGKHIFFRLHETPTQYRYSEDSHQRINGLLSGLLISLEVERFEQGFDRTAYLLRADSNYVALTQLIQIKRGNLEEPDPNFLLNVLNFLQKLIPVLVAEQIEAELSLASICFKDDRIRFCDYNLFFYPCNRRVDNPMLQNVYMRRAASIVYSLLTFKDPKKKTEVEPSQATALLLALSEKQPYKSNDLYKEVIRTLLLENLILSGRLQLLTQRFHYDLAASLTDSNITMKDSIHDILSGDYPLSKKNTMTTIADLNQKPAQIFRKRTKLLMSIFFLLVLIAGISVAVYFFAFTPQVCKSNQFKDGQNCVPCADGCKKCVGQKNNQCTACWGELWLVKRNYEDVAGVCQVQCIGEKYQGRMCVNRTAQDDLI